MIKGLQAGSSDYITKPFQPQEVLARIETQLRLYMGDMAALQVGHIQPCRAGHGLPDSALPINHIVVKCAGVTVNAAMLTFTSHAVCTPFHGTAGDSGAQC